MILCRGIMGLATVLLAAILLLGAASAQADEAIPLTASDRVFIASVATDARVFHAAEPEGLAIQILQAARRHSLDPYLVAAVIRVESGYNPYAVSKAGALGLMQVMPFWREVLAVPRANLMKPAVNLDVGCQVLARYLKQYGGKVTRALGAYHGSWPSRVYPQKIEKAYAALY